MRNIRTTAQAPSDRMLRLGGKKLAHHDRTSRYSSPVGRIPGIATCGFEDIFSCVDAINDGAYGACIHKASSIM